jgi:hypothetical protein
MMDMEYFLFPIEAGVKGGTSAVMAVPIDPSMDAYYIELDHAEPHFLDSQSMEDRVSLREAYHRETLDGAVQNLSADPPYDDHLSQGRLLYG